MHSLVRQIHLYAGFTIGAFVLMYFVTGYVLTRGPLFGQASESVSRRTVSIPATVLGSESDGAELAAALKREFRLSGKCGEPRQRPDGSWRLEYHHPGCSIEVILTADSRSATIIEKRYGWQRTLVGYHRLHGYGGGWLYTLWAVIYDLASVSMIVFAITGVLLWHRFARPRWPGWAILAVGFLFTASTLAYLLFRP